MPIIKEIQMKIGDRQQIPKKKVMSKRKEILTQLRLVITRPIPCEMIKRLKVVMEGVVRRVMVLTVMGLLTLNKMEEKYLGQRQIK